MKENICKLSEYIKKNPVTFDTERDTPCLETLWWQYSESLQIFSFMSFTPHFKLFSD